MKETIGFIGLGNMGLAIATNLLKAGFGMRVYNRSAEKARPLLEQGASLVRSPAEAAVPGGVVVTMVSDDRAVEAVTLGANGLLDRLGDGVHLAMSTIAPRTTSRLAGLHRERGAGYVASFGVALFDSPDQIAARYSLGCDCRSCLASTFRPVGVSIFSASSFSSRCSAS